MTQQRCMLAMKGGGLDFLFSLSLSLSLSLSPSLLPSLPLSLPAYLIVSDCYNYLIGFVMLMLNGEKFCQYPVNEMH